MYNEVRACSTCIGYIRRLLPRYLPRSRIRHPGYTPLEIDKNSYPTIVHVNNLKEANFKDYKFGTNFYRFAGKLLVFLKSSLMNHKLRSIKFDLYIIQVYVNVQVLNVVRK